MVHLFAVVHRGVVDGGSMVHSVVSGVVDNWDGVGNHLVVLLPASLGVKGEGDLLAAGLSDDDLLLVNGVGGIDEHGNIEALVLNLVFALDLGGLAVSDDILPLVDVGADLPLDNSVGLLAD